MQDFGKGNLDGKNRSSRNVLPGADMMEGAQRTDLPTSTALRPGPSSTASIGANSHDDTSAPSQITGDNPASTAVPNDGLFGKRRREKSNNSNDMSAIGAGRQETRGSDVKKVKVSID